MKIKFVIIKKGGKPYIVIKRYDKDGNEKPIEYQISDRRHDTSILKQAASIQKRVQSELETK